MDQSQLNIEIANSILKQAERYLELFEEITKLKARVAELEENQRKQNPWSNPLVKAI